MVPALSVLDRVALWPLGAAPGTEGALTLEHLALTLIVSILTTALARNVPALLEMLLLRLPINPGSRYALTTISYVLVFTGFLVVLGVLGVTWSSIQWLVAPFGVGLGFGLQEIFANLVSGLLLLMERPVRGGDTITVGGVTGTVTRIRIRATTIQDWDLKELVVPNKDLVTGHLLNWTLSDAANRVTLLVGVAYESDADQVTHVLQEIVEAEPLVLKSPPPPVVFEAFGDSGASPRTRPLRPARRAEPVRATGYGWAVSLREPRSRWDTGRRRARRARPRPSAPGPRALAWRRSRRATGVGRRRAPEEPSTGLRRRVGCPAGSAPVRGRRRGPAGGRGNRILRLVIAQRRGVGCAEKATVHPDRNEQFEHINAPADRFLHTGTVRSRHGKPSPNC